MSLSFLPLLWIGLAIGLITGLVVGAIGYSVFLSPPCPACPVVVCSTPEPCPTPAACSCYCEPCPTAEACPETDDEGESNYYRGLASACLFFGLAQGVDENLAAQTCNRFVNNAYDLDWYRTIDDEHWIWPPVEVTPEKKSTPGP